MLPKNSSDLAGLSAFVFGGLFLLWYEAGVILQFYIDHHLVTYPLFYYVIAGFFAIQIYGNMLKIHTDHAFISGQKLSGSKSQYFNENGFNAPKERCNLCLINIPPRAHHCPVCQKCVFKRDHHCFFAGMCIGYQNHRYYVVMVTYMFIAAVFCNAFNFRFVCHASAVPSIWNFWWFLLPHFGWILGYYDAFTFGINVLSLIGFMIQFLFLWLLIIQISQIRHGQTQYEQKKNITKYGSPTLLDNVKDVFGERYFLTFLFPFIQSKLPGNGIEFTTGRKHGD